MPGYTKPDPDKATPKDLAIAVDAVAQSASHAIFSINFVWTLVAGFLVMFMQAGFALVETGLIRAKNASHTMSMNFAVYALGMFGFFVCGFAFMCGGFNGTAIGGPVTLGGLPTLHSMFTVGVGDQRRPRLGPVRHHRLLPDRQRLRRRVIVLFLFMMVFMDTTATIVTGACAERWSFKSFFIFSIFIGAFIYPIFGCWVWGGGWLAQLGYRAGLGHGAVDYAGSGVVHLQGGALALITAYLIGPRIGKYGKDGKVNPILPHHIPMVQVGTFILAFGWFGFNAGSSLAGADGRIGIVAVNTMIAGMAATLSGDALHVEGPRQARSVDDVQQHARRPGGHHRALRIRHPGGRVHHRRGRRRAGHLERLLLRPPQDRRSGRRDQRARRQRLLGRDRCRSVLGRQLRPGLERRRRDRVPRHHRRGAEGRHRPLLRRRQAAGRRSSSKAASASCWNVIVGGVIFFVIGKVLGSNRVSAEVEIAGLDVPEMGLPGYPEFITTRTPSEVPASEVAAASASTATVLATR